MLEIIIYDDDMIELNFIRDILQKIFLEQKIGCEIKCFVLPDKMVKNVEKADIGILNISSKINGITLGKRLKEKFPDIHLVYLSKNEHDCMQAINEVHAFSFLCKPLNQEILQKQMLEILNIFPHKSITKEFYNVTDNNRRKYALIKLKLEDILYFEYIKRQRKVAIVLTNKTYEYECVFETLTKELECHNFAVNCRGSLVNLSHVVKIKGGKIYLDNEHTLSLSQKRVADFKKRLNEFLQKS